MKAVNLRRAVGWLVFASALSALVVALAAFIYQTYRLIREGVPRDEVSFEVLLTDVMNLEGYAILGAGVGFVVALVGIIVSSAWRAVSTRRAKGT